jgi:hypothetical protein
MSKDKLLITLWLAFLWPSFGSATPKLDIYSIAGNTCAEWKRDASSPSAIKSHYFWFLGFISGNNFALPGSQVPANKMLTESGFVDLVTAKCAESQKYNMTIIAMEFIEDNSPPLNDKSTKK